MIPTPHIVRRGHGSPIIAVHGNGVDHRILLPLDACLSNVGEWERIYLDLPGFGGTPPLENAGGVPEIAEWVRSVVHDLVGDTPYALLANSMGGVFARDLVARMPDQVLGVALIAPVVDPVAERRRVPQKTTLQRDDALISSLSPSDTQEYQEMAVLHSADTWERFQRAVLPGVHAAHPEAVERLAHRYEMPSVPEKISPSFSGPCLIVTGRQDHVVGYEDQITLLSHYPRATFAALDKAGHNVHLEQPALVEALLREWLQRLQ